MASMKGPSGSLVGIHRPDKTRQNAVLCTQFRRCALTVHCAVHSLCTQLCTGKGKIVHSTVHSHGRPTSYASARWLSAQWGFAPDFRTLAVGAVLAGGTGGAVLPRSRKAGGEGGDVKTRPENRRPALPLWGWPPQTPAQSKAKATS